jgi:type I pantothenate kinase
VSAAAWAPPAPFRVLDRDAWAAGGAGGTHAPPTGPLDAAEWSEVYVPLGAFIGLHLDARTELRHRLEAAGWHGGGPFLIGLAGSVAVGKSTCAQALAALIAHRPDRPAVTVVSTDGFLFSNAVLARRDLTARKGFPETYDRDLIADVLGRLTLGHDGVAVPRYSHRVYDIAGPPVVLGRPDVVIVEGVNALDPVIADFCSLLLYLDAAEEDLSAWFAERFASLVGEAADDPGSFFAPWVGMTAGAMRDLSLAVWEHVNLVNLREHILPTRWRADVVLRKGPSHAVTDVAVRLR